MTNKLGNISSVGEQNRLRALDLLRRHGNLSRQQLATETGLDRSTLSKIITELINFSVIKEIGKAESKTVGKKQVLLEIVEESTTALAIHCSRNQVNICLLALNGKMSRQENFEMNKVITIENIINNFVSKHEIDTTKLSGIGIALPGIIDNVNGKVLKSDSFGNGHFPEASTLRNKFNVPVIYENAANAAALSEALISNELLQKSLLFLNVTFTKINEFYSLGFGTGLIINGELFTGKGYGAGELSSKLNPGSELESICEESVEILASKSTKLNRELHTLVKNIIDSLIMLNVFMPTEKIVIGGNRLIRNKIFFERIAMGMNDQSENGPTKITACQFNENAPAIGAGLSLLNRLSLKELIHR